MRSLGIRFVSLASIGALVASCAGGDSMGEGVSRPEPPAPEVPSPGGGADTPTPGDAGRVPTDEELDTPPVDTTVPAVQFIGRFDTSDPTGPECGWPGCRIVARFEGTEVSASFDEKVDDWMIGGPSEWDIVIDGTLLPKLVLGYGTQRDALATDLPAGTHTIELYKRSEAQNGVTQFLGFDFGHGRLLPPNPRKTRRIEIIGDSTSAGFGIEGEGPVCPGTQQAATFQNFHRSYGALLGEAFDAEVSGTAYSGKGIVKNIYRPDTETMPILYGRANPVDPNSTFALSSYVPKVIVSMIGGLDFAVGVPYDDGPEPVSDFASIYSEFLATLRKNYPDAEIFCVVSPSAADVDADHPIREDLQQGVTAAVNDRNAKGDAHVTLVVPPIATPDELTGCEGHGNPGFHQRLAKQLADVVRSKTSWK